MRTHDALIDLVLARQRRTKELSREAQVVIDILKEHNKALTTGFGDSVISIIENAYILTDTVGERS
jgi:hypothetical protein